MERVEGFLNPDSTFDKSSELRGVSCGLLIAQESFTISKVLSYGWTVLLGDVEKGVRNMYYQWGSVNNCY